MTLEVILNEIKRRNYQEDEFVEVVTECLQNLEAFFRKYPRLLNVVPALCEPEESLQFRVVWQDDREISRVNRGFRVQFNQVLGPCRGLIRFRKNMTMPHVKMLAFEQMMKNSLTTFNAGAAVSGADFDPHGKSDAEVFRFCQSFAAELSQRCRKSEVDTALGDIGVGNRELSIIYGEYKRHRPDNSAVVNGKGWGASLGCQEATGYGIVYLLNCAITTQDKKGSLKGKKICISGSGKVAISVAEKLIELEAIVLSLSDSYGTIFESNGFTSSQLKQLIAIKNKKGKCAEYKPLSKTALYLEGPCKKPWNINCDVAIPCAVENEINLQNATTLCQRHECRWVFEGSNVACTPQAVQVFHQCGVNYFPSKVASLGGVALSALEASKNSTRLFWSKAEMEEQLKTIMSNVYKTCRDAAKELGRPNDFQMGANAAGLRKLAETMIQQGYVYVDSSSS